MALRINSMVKFYTLLLLSEQPKHGYELMKELEEKLDRKISPSQVYPFLSTLAGNNMVDAKKKGERDKKTYNLTRKGREFVDVMLARFGELAQSAVSQKITECANCACRIYGNAHSQMIKGKKAHFCCKYCAGSFRSRMK
ncbi:PadR family transcriptional regulator [Candidatus Woesearchaeota archaeon]|nr:PadR family transcriptional regulator [Candidatus Woesearchaeota archaeon]